MRKLLFPVLFNLLILGLFSLYSAPAAAQSGDQATDTATVVADTPAPRGPSTLPVYAVTTATPYPDGSIIHIVQSGQTLYTIAEAYSVTVQSILDLNRRRLDDRLFVGDKLLIREAFTPTPTPNVTDTSTPRPPTATRRPTRTATLVPPTSTPSPTVTITPTATPVPELGIDPVGNVLLSVVVVLLVLGVLFVLAGVIMKFRAPPG
jgi:LysM repeat protein